MLTRTGLDVEALENDDDEELESGMRENKREARFMMYWKTNSLTSTTTTYTGTSKLASLECTPSNFELKSC